MASFQLALAAGAPWGRASYGGVHEGVLPGRLRIVSGGAALVYAGMACALASAHTPYPVRRRLLTGVTVVMTLGTVANAASPSGLERAIWTPTTALLAASSWRARRRDPGSRAA